MSLTTSRAEAFLREHLYSLQQSVSSWDMIHRWRRQSISWKSVTTFAQNLRDDPPIYRQKNEQGVVEIMVRLPYVVGPVTLDVFAFAASAVIFRIYLFWRGRSRRKSRPGDDGRGCTPPSDSSSRLPSPPVKAKRVVGYQDANLHQTMKECQRVKQKLRKVQDPEKARKERQRQLKYNSNRKGGYLGMSQDSLQRARQHLKQVVASNKNNNNNNNNNQPSYSNNDNQANRWPLTTKENKM
jgi:hypothetical protein